MVLAAVAGAAGQEGARAAKGLQLCRVWLLNQSTRVVNIDFDTRSVHLEELLVQKLTERIWILTDKICFESSEIIPCATVVAGSAG